VGINSAGDAVGFAKPISGHAFLYNGTTMTDLYNAPGATYQSAIQSYSGGNLSLDLGKGIAINDKGDMVGHYAGGSGDFYWSSGGNAVDIGNLGGGATQAGATGINDSDVVVGNSGASGINPADQPWIWTSSGGIKSLFDTQPAGVALAIDNSDNVVGQIGTGTSGAQYAFIAKSAGGTVPFATACVDLGTLSGDASSIAWSVANGNVVGQSVNSSGAGRAVLWAGGTAGGILDLNTAIPSATGWDLNCAYGVSGNGYIVGSGTIGGQTDGFLLTPALPGDANLDGKVDINDLTVVLAHYGETGTTWTQGEFTGDGTVDINDLTIVLAHYGNSSSSSAPAAAAVPEPSTISLVLAVAASLLALAWRHWSRL
jgi:probable HAF family extracellular repeat protein